MKSFHLKIFTLFFCVVTLVNFQSEVSAQEVSEKFILLKRGTKQKNQIKYRVGDLFIYKISDFDFFLEDVIVDIQKDIIVLKENILKPEDILAVNILEKDERNQTLRNISQLGMGGGIVFLTGFTLSSLIQEGNLSQLESSWPLPAALFGAGLAMSFVRYKTFRHKGRNKIQLIILYEE